MGDKPSRPVDRDQYVDSDPYPRQKGASEPFMFQKSLHQQGIPPGSVERASQYVPYSSQNVKKGKLLQDSENKQNE